MQFKDIKQFTRSAQYTTTVPWSDLERTLSRYNKDGQLQLDPEFQRAHVWTEEKQRAYVEFVLKGGKSSRDIFFNMAGWMSSWKGPMYLVDGKQRIEAVSKFLRNELEIFITQDVNFAHGYFFKDFKDSLPWEASFTFHVNDLKSYSEVLQWYLDLNTGGVIHTPEEIEKVKIILNAEQDKEIN